MVDIKVEEFMLEDSAEEKKLKRLQKGLDGAKQYAYSLLARAHGIHKRLKEGEMDPLMLGKAVGFLIAFRELAPIIGIDNGKFQGICTILTEKLGEATVVIREKVAENQTKKVLIEHRRDPKGVEADKDRAEAQKKAVELREIKVVDEREEKARQEAEKPPEMDKGKARVVELVVQALSGSTLGYSKKEAMARAIAVYREGATTEELIGDACRANI